jgi:hypothetical protein
VPDDAQMRKALEKLVETLDCVGHQLSARKDRKAALWRDPSPVSSYTACL